MTPTCADSDSNGDRDCRGFVRALLYELDGLDDNADRIAFVQAVLLWLDVDPERDVVLVRGTDGGFRLDSLPHADVEDALDRARAMIAYADAIADDDLVLGLDGSIRRRADLPLATRLRDRAADLWGHLPGGPA